MGKSSNPDLIQTNKGHDNINISFSGNKIFVQEPCTIDMATLWAQCLTQYEDIDKELAVMLPEQRIVESKTNEDVHFSSSKIMSSLIKVGVPLPATVTIISMTHEKIREWVEKNKNAKKPERLTTKIIRRMVSTSIQEINNSGYTKADIERWNLRYVRRYGHNDRIIQIYDIPSHLYSEKLCDISYNFIENILLKDIFATMAPSVNFAGLEKSHKEDLTREIMSFINNCDLYMIKYSLFKDMIIEIALQPPHPWIITDSERQRIINYDYLRTKHNMKIAREYVEKNTAIPYSIVVEILHHASAILLDAYFTFLGCYDLTAFEILKSVLETLVSSKEPISTVSDACTPTKWDLVVSDYSFRDLYDDFEIANVRVSSLVKTMNTISNGINTGRAQGTLQESRRVLDFAETILKIHETGRKKKFSQFFDDEWNQYSTDQIHINVRIFFSLIYPYYRKKEPIPSHNAFLLRYSHLSPESPLKDYIFIVIERDGNFDVNILDKLHTKIQCCNSVFFVSEYFSNLELLKQTVMEKLCTCNLQSYITPFFFCKEDMKSIFNAEIRHIKFNEILDEQICSLN